MPHKDLCRRRDRLCISEYPNPLSQSKIPFLRNGAGEEDILNRFIARLSDSAWSRLIKICARAVVIDIVVAATGWALVEKCIRKCYMNSLNFYSATE